MQGPSLPQPQDRFLWDSVIERILGGPGKGVTGAMVKNVKTGAVGEVACGGIFMAIGHELTPCPPRQAADGPGRLPADEGRQYGHQRARRVFAAGDVADPHYRQAVTAAGGRAAAIDAERFLSH